MSIRLPAAAVTPMLYILFTQHKSLREAHPELAAQADGWEPTSITSGSGKRVRWLCEFRHSWTARVADRVKGSGCPVCANKVVLPGFNDLATTNPDLDLQAVGWDPTKIARGSN